jgi:hypothetical protein
MSDTSNCNTMKIMLTLQLMMETTEVNEGTKPSCDKCTKTKENVRFDITTKLSLGMLCTFTYSSLSPVPKKLPLIYVIDDVCAANGVYMYYDDPDRDQGLCRPGTTDGYESSAFHHKLNTTVLFPCCSA